MSKHLTAALLILAMTCPSLSNAFNCDQSQTQTEKILSLLYPGARLRVPNGGSYKVIAVSTVQIVVSTILDPSAPSYIILVNGESINPNSTSLFLNRKVSLNLARLVGCNESEQEHSIQQTSVRDYLTKN